MPIKHTSSNTVTTFRHTIPLSVVAVTLFLCGCATTRTATDYIDGTIVDYTPIVEAGESLQARERFNVAINLFLPGADLDKLEEEGSGIITTDESGIPRIDHKAIDPKIRRLETHFLPTAMKKALDESGQWGQTFVSPGTVLSPDLFINANILASDGHSIALIFYVNDSTGRTWYNEMVEYNTDEYDYQVTLWPDRDPYDAIFHHVANKLVEVRNGLTPEEQKRIRLVSQMRFANDLAPDVFENYLAKNADNQLYVQRFPAENDPTYQVIKQLHGTELEMLTHIEEYYDNLHEGVWDPYTTWREQFRSLSIEMEQYRVEARNQKTSSLVTGILMVAAAAASGAEYYERGDSYGVAQSAAILVGGLELSKAMYDAAKEKIEIANLKAKELSEISTIAGEGMQPKVIELEGRTYQLTGDVEDRFRQIRSIIRTRYLLETGQEDLAPDDTQGSI